MRAHRPFRRPGRPDNPIAARTAMERVARTLGVGVIVETIEPGPPATIRAMLIFAGTPFGSADHDATVVSAPTEAAAWRRLAAEIAAWRRGNSMAIPYWFGGGGG